MCVCVWGGWIIGIGCICDWEIRTPACQWPSIGSVSILPSQWLVWDTCWVTDMPDRFRSWVRLAAPEKRGCLSHLRCSLRLGFSLQFLHCAGLPEVFTLALTLPGKPRKWARGHVAKWCLSPEPKPSFSCRGWREQWNFGKKLLLGIHFNKPLWWWLWKSTGIEAFLASRWCTAFYLL
jgi:hypothetical protein